MARLRGRMPLIAFILLAVLCVALLGFACACLSDQPAQAVDRAVSAGASVPAVIEVWSVVLATLAGVVLVFVVDRRAASRASPVMLQRFLF